VALGYIVTSLYHADFGFTVTSPLRPKIVAAGVWFLILTVLPAVLTSVTFEACLPAGCPLWRNLNVLLMCSWTDVLLGVFTASFFDFSETSVPSSPVLSLFAIYMAAVIALCAIVALRTDRPAARNVISLVGILAGLAACISRITSNHQLVFSGLVLWFFCVGLVAIERRRAFRRQNRDPMSYWVLSGVLFLSSMSGFAFLVYGHLKSSWGGGSPVLTVLYFSNESRMLPNQQVKAKLLDESESGYYIIPENEKKAIFVPRNSVSLVYFSGGQPEPKLLMQPKKP
jgi:hypothetical protein